MRMIKALAPLLAVTLGSAAWTATGPIYRWVDPQGRVHYGDRPAAGSSARPLQAGELPPVNLQQKTEWRRAAPVATKKRVRAGSRAVRPRGERADCKQYREKIRGIEQRLRQGYAEPAGARLHRSKRRWSDLLYQHCY